MGGVNTIYYSSLTFEPPLWPHFFSLEQNYVGPEAGKAIAEALKVNTSITNIR